MAWLVVLAVTVMHRSFNRVTSERRATEEPQKIGAAAASR